MSMDPLKNVSEILRTELWTLTPDTGIASAMRLATESKIRHFLVLDDGVLAGAVSARVLRAARPTQLVGEVMSSPVLCIAPETTVAEATQMFAENGVGFLPIIGEGVLMGYVTDRQLRDEPEAPINAGAAPYSRRPD
jgi:CBS domain-containing protein